MQRTRDWRRFQRERILRKRRHYYNAGQQVWRMAKTPKPCSCVFCGNDRRHFGWLPPQEARATGHWRVNGRRHDEIVEG